MKFKLVDRVLQRQLVPPSSLQESQDQPSSQEHDIPQTAQAPPIEQVQQHSSPPPIVQEQGQATTTVHSQEAQPEVSLLDTQIHAPTIQVSIEEPPVISAKQTAEP